MSALNPETEEITTIPELSIVSPADTILVLKGGNLYQSPVTSVKSAVSVSTSTAIFTGHTTISYTDTDPVVLANSDFVQYITKVTVKVNTPFNGTNTDASITVTLTTTGDIFDSVSDSFDLYTNSFDSIPRLITNTASDNIILVYTPDSAADATQGEVEILVEYSKP